MPNFDLSTLLPIIFAMLGGPIFTWIFSAFPLVKQIVTAMPQSFFAALVKAKDPGATVAWSASAAEKRALLTARRDEILATIASGSKSGNESEQLASVQVQLAALPTGGIMDWIKEHPLILVAIVGGIFFATQGGGCKKMPVPTPAKASAVEVLK